MIEKLTPEQEALMPVIRDEWIDRALRAKDVEISQESAEALTKYLYELAGFTVPPTVVVSSPIAAQRLANERNNTQKEYYSPCWVISDCGWLAHYDYFTRIEAIDFEPFNTHLAAVLNCPAWEVIAFDELSIVVERPSKVRRDTENRLHSDQLPAIEWRDGEHLYYLQGVEFDKETWQKIIDQTFTIEDLMGIENADKRAVATSMLKPELLLSHVNAEFVNEGTKGTKLYRVPNFLDSGQEQFCMTMECPSTGRMFLEWVDPEIGRKGDADLAQASSFVDADGNAISVEEYRQLIEA